MLFTSHNTSHITLGIEQCLKLLLEFATLKIGSISLYLCFTHIFEHSLSNTTSLKPSWHGGRWSNWTCRVPALPCLLSTCVVFWSLRRRVVEYGTRRLSSLQRVPGMYITLDCSASTNMKRHKYDDLVKLLAFMSWVHFFFHNNNFSFLIIDCKVELQKSLKWSYIYLCLESHPCLLFCSLMPGVDNICRTAL